MLVLLSRQASVLQATEHRQHTREKHAESPHPAGNPTLQYTIFTPIDHLYLFLYYNDYVPEHCGK